MSITALGLCLAITASSSSVAPLSDAKIKFACEHAQELIDASNTYGLDPFIMAGLIWVESRWTANAVSRSNACGLTQVLPKYVPETCKQLKDPKTSLYAGARALRKWSTVRKWNSKLKKYERVPRKGGMKVSLACYNAGNVCDGSKRGRSYSHKIRKLATWLEKWHKDNPQGPKPSEISELTTIFIYPVLDEIRIFLSWSYPAL